MSGQVRPAVSKERNAAFRAVFDESAAVYRSRFIGESAFVLWESITQLNESGWQMEGLSDNYLRVSAEARSPRWNVLDEVRLMRSEGDKLYGEIILTS